MRELEDYPWFPTTLRKFQTDYIGFVVAKFNIYDGFVNYLKNQNIKSKVHFDLCSGSGEPAISIFNAVNIFDKLILSDKYPSYKNIEKLDVLEANFSEEHTYTMFNAFHHFNDTEKINIVQKIKQANAKAYFVEILEPTVLYIFKVLFATIIGTLLLSPFIKPFSLKRLFFTYIIPINIINISYDGILSVLKSRSKTQLEKLFLNDHQVKIIRIKKDIRILLIIAIENEHIQNSLEI